MSHVSKTQTSLHPDCLSFLNYLQVVKKYSPHTLQSYGNDLQVLSELLREVPPQQISNLQIRKLANQLHTQDLNPKTIARHLSCWRGFFNWLALQHPENTLDHVTMLRNPVLGIKAPKSNKGLPKALSVDEAVQLVESQSSDSATQTANRAMFELLYSSGLRVSELVGLDCAFCKQDGYVSTSWVDWPENMVHVVGKGNKVREVPIGSAAREALDAWMTCRASFKQGKNADDVNALFLTQRGTRMSVRLVQLRIKAHAKQLGIKSDVHPHVLRHSFASHVLQSSGDLRAVQELLGHSSLASTQVYTALDFQHLAQTYDAAHPRAKIK